jgi:flavodoxin
MKKLVSIFMFFALLLSFAACSSNTKNEESSSSTPQSSEPSSTTTGETNNQSGSSELSTPDYEPTETASKLLVVYFSWSGNTKKVAEAIQTQTDSDIFEIVPVIPYSDDYDTVVDLAQEEQKGNARPAISGSIDNINDYDVIYVGFPNWWGDMPMILYTFFDSYDLSGKTIAPFCTSGGSGLSNTVNEIKELEPNATVTDGLHIGSSSASNPDNAVSDWLSKIGL